MAPLWMISFLQPTFERKLNPRQDQPSWCASPSLTFLAKFQHKVLSKYQNYFTLKSNFRESFGGKRLHRKMSHDAEAANGSLCFWWRKLMKHLPAPNAKKKFRSGCLFNRSITLFAMSSFLLKISSVLKYLSMSLVACISSSLRVELEFMFASRVVCVENNTVFKSPQLQ